MINNDNLHLRTMNKSVARINVYSEKFFERKLKVSTDIAKRMHSKANENLIFKIMQFVKWVVD